MSKAIFEQSGISDSLKPLTSGTRSSSDMRNALAALHQTDFAPLRARAQGFDTLSVWVNGAIIEGYYMPVLNVNGESCTYVSGVSPTTWAPPSNARIDILHINGAEPSPQLYWVSGTPGASPSIPSLSSSGTPIAAIYHRAGAARILATDDASNSYLYRDMRPLYSYKETFTPSVSNALSGSVIKTTRNQRQALETLTHSGSAWGNDTGAPQITEGAPYTNLDTTHTAESPSNTLIVDISICTHNLAGNGASMTAALFRDSVADALAVCTSGNVGDNTGGRGPQLIRFTFSEQPADTSAHTYKIRLQGSGQVEDIRVNTADGGATNNLGGKFVSSMTIQEIKA